MNDKLYIGISGFARSGKDLCGKIIIDILFKNGYTPHRFSLADEMKIDVEEFLNIKCNTSSYTTNTKEKTKIRPFLVWYGCYQRDHQPDYWIKKVEGTISKNNCNVVVCTDIRFKNEADWIHSKNGWVIHLTKYTKESNDFGKTWIRKYQTPPNNEETENDPIVKNISDYKIVWENLSNDTDIDINKLTNNVYLREKVFESLKSYPKLNNISLNYY